MAEVFLVQDQDEFATQGVFANLQDAVMYAHALILSRTHDWTAGQFIAHGYDYFEEHLDLIDIFILNVDTRVRYGYEAHEVMVQRFDVQEKYEG